MEENNIVYTWNINTKYCYHGIPLSNGVFGVLVWFENNKIMLTINRADYWDRRGKRKINDKISYKNIKALLSNGKIKETKELFDETFFNGYKLRQTRLPMGRFELKVKDQYSIYDAKLNITTGEALIFCRCDNNIYKIKIGIEKDDSILMIKDDGNLIESLYKKAAYSFKDVKEYYDTRGIEKPIDYEQDKFLGFIQELPEDPSCACIAYHYVKKIYIAAEYGDDYKDALYNVKNVINKYSNKNYEQFIETQKNNLTNLWNKTAKIEIEDKEIEEMYYMGIYKMFGNSMPNKLAPTLQGPWVEEFRMPFWSADYHFNINVQLCLIPAYASNNLDCLKPLFKLLKSWDGILMERAEKFANIQDGIQLCHATDDNGNSIGNYWLGAIDHANTSWISQLMWQYYRYSMDEEFLINEIYPFMKGTMKVFIEMMEYDGEKYIIPISTSPEYSNAKVNGYGENSSFYLANIHFLCEKLIEIEKKYCFDNNFLKKITLIKEKLPICTIGSVKTREFSSEKDIDNKEIYLWKDQPLEYSHRHHSHLAGIYPFDIFDLEDDTQKDILENSYKSWISKGMGNWAGWSFPWASIIHARMGRSDMAYFCLKILKEYYGMLNYGLSHNGAYEGFSTFWGWDVYEVDACISYAAAVLEMYVQNIRGWIKIFPALPNRFKNAGFKGIRAEGGFIISSSREDGEIKLLKIISEKGQKLKIYNPFGADYKVHIISDYRNCEIQGEKIIVETKCGEVLNIRKIF